MSKNVLRRIALGILIVGVCPLSIAQLSTQANAKEMASLIKTALSKSHMSPSLKTIDGDSSPSAFDIKLRYAANEAVKAELEVFTVQFVRALVAANRDPTVVTSRRFVHVCAIQDGLETVSGKPGIRQLGCAHYNPYSDQVTFE